MKRKTKASSKIVTFVLVTTAVVLSAALFCGVYFAFSQSGAAPTPDLDVSVAVNGEKQPSETVAALEPDVPSTEPEEESASDFGLNYVRRTFICAGDNLIHTDVYGAAARYGSEVGEEYDFKPMFADIKPLIGEYDYAFLNQEVPIAGKELGFSGYPCFNSPDELGDAVVDTGFNIINVATNHMLDKRNIGLKNAVEYWRKKPVTLIGGYLSKKEYDTIEYIEDSGLKIALLAYTYGTNGIVLQNNGDPYVVPYIDEADIKAKTARARSEGANLVFVSIHWGYENTPTPSDEQERLAQMMADIGVDVVIGHHSHSVQPTVWLDRPDGGKTLVTYSLGNLLSGMQSPINIIGGMLSFDVEYFGGETKPTVNNVKVIPTVCHFSGYPRDYKVYLFTNYTPELAAKHRLADKLTFKEMKSMVTRTVDEEFLTEEFLNK